MHTTTKHALRALGMVTVHWNTDPGDWRHASSDQMVATTLAQVAGRPQGAQPPK